MRRGIMQITVPFIIAVVLVVAGVRYLEYKSIFYPARSVIYTPASIGLPFEDIFIKTEDHVIINAWLVKSSTAGKGTLIFCHGNAGNIGDRLDKIRLFHRMGLNVLIMDYRGYGKSRGRPSEAGIYKDAAAAYDYLRSREDSAHSPIIGYGDSLGGAVVIDLAAKRDLSALIVHSSFTSAADMAKRIYPFIPSFLLGTKLDSAAKLRGITAPKLFIHSRADEIVPFQLGERLYQAALQPKEFLEISGGHNDTPAAAQEKMSRGIIAFLRRHNVLESPAGVSDE